jgi:NAD(P)H-hydrate epimerase
MPPNEPLPALPPRPKDSHKASVGRVLIVGGSRGMAGAPALCARGALRAGAGLVTIAVPARIADIVAGFLPEAMVIALPCDDDGALDSSADEAVLARLERVDALVVGPGLGRAPQTEAAILALLAKADKPVVLDADGLYAIRGRVGDLATRSAATILTPHEGEATALLGESQETGIIQRESRARRLATTARGICVLKGPGTIVTDGTRVFVNETGNPLLSTGGTGDVLSGVVAAFVAGLPATGGDAFGAAALAVHLHGAAADLLRARRGDRGTLASEIADALPEAIRAWVEGGEKSP